MIVGCFSLVIFVGWQERDPCLDVFLRFCFRDTGKRFGGVEKGEFPQGIIRLQVFGILLEMKPADN